MKYRGALMERSLALGVRYGRKKPLIFVNQKTQLLSWGPSSIGQHNEMLRNQNYMKQELA